MDFYKIQTSGGEVTKKILRELTSCIFNTRFNIKNIKNC